MARVVEVPAPSDASIDTLRRTVQQLNRQIQALQAQVDAIRAQLATR